MPSLSEEAARRRRKDAYGLSREASLSLSDPQDRPSYSSVASRATDELEQEEQPATPTRVALDLDRLGIVTEPSGIFSPIEEQITFHQGDSSSDNAEAIRPGGLFDNDEDDSDTGGDLNDNDPGDQEEDVQDDGGDISNMPTEVPNLDGDFIALLNTTKLAVITADKKTDNEIAIALSQKYATIESLIEDDPKAILSDFSTYTDGGDTKDVPITRVRELLKVKVWMHYLRQQLNRNDFNFTAYPNADTTYQKYRDFKDAAYIIKPSIQLRSWLRTRRRLQNSLMKKSYSCGSKADATLIAFPLLSMIPSG